MIERTPERCKTRHILRAGTDAGNLKWFVPIGVEHENANNHGAVGISVGVDANRVPHLFDSLSTDLLCDCDRKGVSPSAKRTRGGSFAVNLKPSVVLGFV